jgi:formate dehydrogenase maturation protein FdhE
MTKDADLKQALEALELANINHWWGSSKIEEAITAIKEALAQPAQEAASIIQAVTDPENQPSQYGTVTLDYHLAKLKEWEDRFEKLSDRALAQPEERNFCPRCGKRRGGDVNYFHTCTPPQENT